MAASNANVIGFIAENESVYGSAGVLPAFTNAADGILLYENKNPYSVEFEELTITPVTGSLAPSKSIVGRGLAKISATAMLQRAESFVATVPTLPQRITRLMRACAVSQVTTATRFIYRPESSGFESLAAIFYPQGWSFGLLGVYGTFTISASAGREQKISFEMQGILPDANFANKNVSVPGDIGLETEYAVGWKGANVTVTTGNTITDTAGLLAVVGGTPVTPELCVKSVTFTAGVSVAERRCANAVNALGGLQISEVRNPRLELVAELDQNPSINWFTDWAAGTVHAVSMNFDDDRINLLVPYAQVVAAPMGEDAGTRTITLTYKCTDPVKGPGLNSDWQISWLG